MIYNFWHTFLPKTVNDNWMFLITPIKCCTLVKILQSILYPNDIVYKKSITEKSISSPNFETHRIIQWKHHLYKNVFHQHVTLLLHIIVFKHTKKGIFKGSQNNWNKILISQKIMYVYLLLICKLLTLWFFSPFYPIYTCILIFPK